MVHLLYKVEVSKLKKTICSNIDKSLKCWGKDDRGMRLLGHWEGELGGGVKYTEASAISVIVDIFNNLLRNLNQKKKKEIWTKKIAKQ